MYHMVDEGSRVMVGCQYLIYSFLLIRDVCWRGRQCVCPTKQCFNHRCFVCNRVMGREIQVLVSMCWFAIYTGGNRTILISLQHDIKEQQTSLLTLTLKSELDRWFYVVDVLQQ